MTLSEKRKIFTHCLALLLLRVNEIGLSCTLGDVYARDGHKKNSFHYQGLAADINLFRGNKYLTKTSDHKEIGEYWKSLHELCTWGGDFSRPDGNHYSFGEK